MRSSHEVQVRNALRDGRVVSPRDSTLELPERNRIKFGAIEDSKIPIFEFISIGNNKWLMRKLVGGKRTSDICLP